MKSLLNRVLRMVGCEIHGLGYLERLSKNSFKERLDACCEVENGLSNKNPIIVDVGAMMEE